jgi:hypothetical protein
VRAAIPASGDKVKGIVMHSLFGIGSATRPSARWGAISVWLGTALLAATATHAVAAPPLDADTDWLASLQQSIAEAEYEASENGLGLQAPNRAHNLRTYFEPDGIRVVDRKAAGSPELLGLWLVGVGRGASLIPVGAGEVASDGARIELRRRGLVEWYVNTPAGLEQGFTLAERPDGEGSLVIELALSGATATLGDDALTIRTTTGRRLRYGKLFARDAGAHPIPARLSLPTRDRVRLLIDDADAVYPLTVDPLLTSFDTQIESNQAGASLGSSVASAGDVNGDGYSDVIVGAHLYDDGQADEGAAFLFLGSASGVSTSIAWSGQSNQANAQYGVSVASAGDVNGDGYSDVIVGAQYYDHPENAEGRAYVYHGGPTGLSAGAYWTEEPDWPDIGFGSGVASAGDVNGDGYSDVIVGAFRWDNGSVTWNEGKVFVYHGSASGLSHTVAFSRESNQDGAQLGRAVSSAGDVNGDGYSDIILGIPYYDISGGLQDEGRVLVYHGSSTGLQFAWSKEGSDYLDGFGASVAAAGDVNGDGYGDVIIGEPGDQKALVYLGSATGLAASPAWSPTFVAAGYGSSVAGAGDVDGDGYGDVLVGAPSYTGGQASEGRAYLYRGGPSGLDTTPDWTVESNSASAALGQSVASAGDVNGDGLSDVIIGADGYDGGEADEGAAFVYLGSYDGLVGGDETTATSAVGGDQAGSGFAVSVASAGDVNGDGYADLIVGAPGYDSGQTNEGAAFVFLAGSGGIPDQDSLEADTQLEADQDGASFGSSVASAGDVNGDGYADVIVGASNYDAGETDEGAAWVFYGSATGVPDGNPATALTQLESDEADSMFGRSVASAGDVNGDGYADVIVGAYRFDVDAVEQGAALIFMGSSGGIVGSDPDTAAAIIAAGQPNAQLGYSVASVGDVNGDGYADVAVGAPYYDSPESSEGAFFIFHGGPLGIGDRDPSSADTHIESNQTSGLMGHTPAAAADVNGDGFPDLIIGSEYYDAGQNNEGAVFVFHGTAAGILDGNPATADALIQSNQESARLGNAVGTAGDVNGDGYADIVVGARLYNLGPYNTDDGRAGVYLGSPSGITGTITADADAIYDGEPGNRLGQSVASLGDVNADGFADVVIGSGSDVNGYAGAALIFHGHDNIGGPELLLRQLRADGSDLPIQPWGSSWSDDSFRVRMNATHPNGRGHVKLEIEACPSGTPFDDPSCTLHEGASWTDVGTSGEVTLTETVSGLTTGTLYRWRARVLYAPFEPPPNPLHGPWRRPTAQAQEADVLVVPEPSVVLGLAAGGALLVGLSMARRRGARGAPRSDTRRSDIR